MRLAVFFVFIKFVFLFTLLEGEKAPGRAREVFKKLPGGRGFVFPEYGPVATHGDPVHDRFY